MIDRFLIVHDMLSQGTDHNSASHSASVIIAASVKRVHDASVFVSYDP